MHLVDVSSASGRDPVEDFDVITRELALFPGRDAAGERLADKPLIVAANKIDALDEPERLERLQRAFAGARHSALRCVRGHRRRAAATARSRVAGELAQRMRQPTPSRRPPRQINDAGSAWRTRRDPRWHARSDSRRPSRDGAGREARLSTWSPCRDARPGAAAPPHGPSASPFHRFAMAALAVNGLPGLCVSTWSCSAEARRTRRRPSSGWRGAGSTGRRFSSSPAPTRSRKSKPGTATLTCWISRTSWWSRGPA